MAVAWLIAEAALQEDVDIVGLSILSGAHMALAPRILELLKANGQENVKVFIDIKKSTFEKNAN